MALSYLDDRDDDDDGYGDYEYIWRGGIPKVRENISRFSIGRGSGKYGSGLYAYKTAAALYNGSDQDSHHLYKVKLNDKIRLFEDKESIGVLDDLISLSEIMNESIWAYIHQSDNFSFTDYDKKMSIAIEHLNPVLKLKKRDLENAINTTLDCIRKFGDTKCSQPINHLLLEKDYDGIMPTHINADANEFGVVIFTESLPKIGKVKLPVEDNVDSIDVGDLISAKELYSFVEQEDANSDVKEIQTINWNYSSFNTFKNKVKDIIREKAKEKVKCEHSIDSISEEKAKIFNNKKLMKEIIKKAKLECKDDIEMCDLFENKIKSDYQITKYG